MKIKDGYILETIGDQKMVVSLDMTPDKFSGMIKLNNVAAFLWEILENEIDEAAMLKAMTEKYDVSEELARKDLKVFLENLEKNGILEK